MLRELTDERKKLLRNTVLIDYLKVNGFRIASHNLQKTPTPLSSRSDIQPLLPLVTEGQYLDILGLDNNSKISFCKTFFSEELLAHYSTDDFFINGLKSILKTDLKDVHYIFITNGIIMPELLMKHDWKDVLGISNEEFNEKISNIEFIETRINIEMLSKLSDQKVYLKNIISKMKIMNREFKESEVEYEGEKCLEGSYAIKFHNIGRNFPYWITPSGIQLEAPDNGEKIGEFVSSFK